MSSLSTRMELKMIALSPHNSVHSYDINLYTLHTVKSFGYRRSDRYTCEPRLHTSKEMAFQIHFVQAMS